MYLLYPLLHPLIYIKGVDRFLIGLPHAKFSLIFNWKFLLIEGIWFRYGIQVCDLSYCRASCISSDLVSVLMETWPQRLLTNCIATLSNTGRNWFNGNDLVTWLLLSKKIIIMILKKQPKMPLFKSYRTSSETAPMCIKTGRIDLTLQEWNTTLDSFIYTKDYLLK